MNIQKHCPNKMIVNNLHEDLYFIYVKDLKEFIKELDSRFVPCGSAEDVVEFLKNTLK